MEKYITSITNIDLNKVQVSEHFTHSMKKLFSTTLKLNEVHSMNIKDQKYLIDNQKKIKSSTTQLNLMDVILEDDYIKDNIIKYMKIKKIDKLESLATSDVKIFLID